jgi:hypothetical protein
MTTTIQNEILTKAARELVQRYSTHEWVNVDKMYRRLYRVDDGWILIKSETKPSSIVYAGRVTRAMPEASAVEGLMKVKSYGLTVKST